MKKVPSWLCAQCKGARKLCGRVRCPILERLEAQLQIDWAGSRDSLSGATPPAVLVGEHGYPKVRVGPLLPPVSGEAAAIYEDPSSWYGKSVEDIIRLRSQLTRPNFEVRVSQASKPTNLLESVQEMVISARPVDAEVKFAKPLSLRLSFDGVVSPVGPSAPLSRLRVVGNPVVPRKVDRVLGDFDVKAHVAIRELYEGGVPVHYITRLMTVGLLGRIPERRMVPTRWGITAVDSIAGDHLLERAKDYPEIDEVLLFSNTYLDNAYYILMVPGAYAFEMLEIWLPRSVWVRGEVSYVVENFELYDGRWVKDGVDGGYKAMRLAALEQLNQMRRQAVVVAVREVGPGYYAPLGVWNVREGVRHAFRKGAERFSNVNEAVASLAKRVKTNFKEWFREARLLNSIVKQRRLSEFMQR